MFHYLLDFQIFIKILLEFFRKYIKIKLANLTSTGTKLITQINKIVKESYIAKRFSGFYKDLFINFLKNIKFIQMFSLEQN